MPDTHIDSRREVAYFMRRLYRRGLTTTSGGNVSLRLPDGSIVITPAGLDKGRMRGAQVAVVSPGGELLAGPRATSELAMHRRIYDLAPAAAAIVHAHPVTACAFAASRSEIDPTLSEEGCLVLGRIARTPYFCTGTPELADAVARAAADGAGAVVMTNHGVTTVGRTLLEAFDRLEVLETLARLTLLARQLDDPRGLAPAELAAIDRLMGRA